MSARVLGFAESESVLNGLPHEVIEKIIEGSTILDNLSAMFGDNSDYYSHIKTQCPNFCFARYWSNAMLVGKCSEYVCTLLPDKNELAGQAYFAGTLHNIGILVLACQFPKEMNEIFNISRSMSQLIDLERQHFAIDHLAVAADTLKKWRVPSSILNAVAHSEDALEGSKHDELTTILIQALQWHRSDYIVSTLFENITENAWLHMLSEKKRINDVAAMFAYE